MSASERPSASGEARLTFSDFHQYRKDHPLWQDITFTSDWLRERVTTGPDFYVPPQVVSESSALLPHEQKEVINAAVARVFLTWTEAEDRVLAYACSPQAQQDGVSLQSVARSLGRPLDQVEDRCKELQREWSTQTVEQKTVAVTEGRMLAGTTMNLRSGRYGGGR